MTALFETVLEMSATASVVIAAVLLVRLLLRRAPKKISFALWIQHEPIPRLEASAIMLPITSAPS